MINTILLSVIFMIVVAPEIKFWEEGIFLNKKLNKNEKTRWRLEFQKINRKKYCRILQK
jgi:hypothetical protein